MQPALSARRRIVLLGAGHTNAHIIRRWGMGEPLPDTELVCVSNYPVATYSGMLPAVLAGDVSRSEMEIDLFRLCRKANVRLIVEPCTAIDVAGKWLRFADRPNLDFDVLSIGIGSRPTFDGVAVATDAEVLVIKPMQAFFDRLASRLVKISQEKRTANVVVVGGGVASFEIVLCLQSRWAKPKQSPATNGLDSALAAFETVDFTVVTADSHANAGLGRSATGKLNGELGRRGISVVRGKYVRAITRKGIHLDDASTVEADMVIWATSARAPELLDTVDLPKDEKGFLLTSGTLQSIANPDIFAVGDSGSMAANRLPKAGVYAVRQGPVLFANLRNVILGRPTVKYLPQTGFLKLVNLGGRRALGEYRGLSWLGPSAWRTKLNIDRNFMAMYQDLSLMHGMAEAHTESVVVGEPMRCLGCGGKVAAKVLRESLQEFQQIGNPSVSLGLEQPDDAAVLKFSTQTAVVTTDYFATPLDDPYLFGRMLAIHATSDAYAMGARPVAALANIEIPAGHARGQARTLKEFLAGLSFEFARRDLALAGGHTIEGTRLAGGLTVFAEPGGELNRKRGLRAGDLLILTKPLGMGLYLAAAMQSELPAVCYDELMAALTQGNEIALELLERFSISAMTDVTGFGLFGHAMEMLAEDQAIEFSTVDIPLMARAERLIEQGIESTLAADNRQLALDAGVAEGMTRTPAVAACFDPQTCGGLLVGVSEEDAQPVVNWLSEHGFPQSAVVARICRREESNVQAAFVQNRRTES